MKVKLICKKENFLTYKNLFESIGVEITENATHIFKELDVEYRNITALDFDGNTVLIEYDDVYLIESYGKIVEVKTFSKTFRIKKKLYQVQSLVEEFGFVKINKSQIIAVSKILKVSPQLNSRLRVDLKNNERVYVSRTFIRDFRKAIEERK